MADPEQKSPDVEELPELGDDIAAKRSVRPFGIVGSPSLEQLSTYNPERIARHGTKLVSDAVYEAHSRLDAQIAVMLSGFPEDDVASFEMELHSIGVSFARRYYLDRFSSEVRSEKSEILSLMRSVNAVALALEHLSIDASNDVARAMFSMSGEGAPGFQLVAALNSMRDVCRPQFISDHAICNFEKSVPEDVAGENVHPAEQWRINLAYLLGHVNDALTRAKDCFAEQRNSDREWDDFLAADSAPSRSRKDRAVALAVQEIEDAWRANGFGRLGRERRRNLLAAVLKPLLPTGDQRTNFENRSRPSRRKKRDGSAVSPE